jgi:hypothetical protein
MDHYCGDALQGALVCALSGTDETGAVTPKSRAETLKHLESGNGPYPEQRLADFKTLLAWAADPRRMIHADGGPLKLTTGQLRDLERLASDCPS